MDSIPDLTVTAVTSANRLLHSPVGVVIARKRRARWAVALKTEGKTVYTAGGKEILSDARHPVLLPKGSEYSWICTEPGECLMIEFEAEEDGTALFSAEVADAAFIKNAFLRIEKSLVLRGNALERKSLLYGVLSAAFCAQEKEYTPKKTEARLRPAAEYMAERYRDPAITNETLARLCGMSVPYFRKLFPRVYGTSPVRYLHDLRIERAKAILASDYGSVSQVAESVGYGGIYHFSKMFRAYTGMSPTEYAKKAAGA